MFANEVRSFEKMPGVFFSHSSVDNELAAIVAEGLEHVGIETWIDYTDIKGGDLYPLKISEAIGWCDSFILIWSASALKSDYIAKE